MYVKGRPCGSTHGTGSRLGQGERSMRTYFPNKNGAFYGYEEFGFRSYRYLESLD